MAARARRKASNAWRMGLDLMAFSASAYRSKPVREQDSGMKSQNLGGLLALSASKRGEVRRGGEKSDF